MVADADARPIEVENVRDEERFFGGDIVWWALLLVVSVPIILYGLTQAPTVFGFFVMSIGGVLAGIAFAQVMLRMPYLTHGFVRSLLIVVVGAVVVGGIALAYNSTLPVPTAPPDVLYKPAISGTPAPLLVGAGDGHRDDGRHPALDAVGRSHVYPVAVARHAAALDHVEHLALA